MAVRLRTAVVGACVVSSMLATQPAQAAFPGQNGKIAFSSNRDDPNPGNCGSSCNSEIYTVNPDGTGLTRLTSDPAVDRWPAWSPDGSRIAFVRGSDIWVMQANGTGQTNLTNGTSPCFCYQPAWSPDGSKIVFVASDTRLWTMASDGTQRTLLDGFVRGFPAWSPDGSLIAFDVFPDSNPRISTVRPDGANETAIAGPGASVDSEPNWSPDGQRIALQSDAPDHDLHIWSMDPHGGGQTQITTAFGVSPAYSPDGSKIAYVAETAQIATVNANGSGRMDLANTSAPVRDKEPDWQAIPINSYPRPRGATPMLIPLVPAYQPCSAPNRTHGAPLAYPSCAPPALTSRYLTVGTPDANGKRTTMEAYILANVMSGNPATPANEADLKLTARVNNVFNKDLTDYTGSLLSRLPIQITDRDNNPSPGGPGAATMVGIPFPFAVPCTADPDPTIGSDCSITTTANTLVPGAIVEGRRALWQIGKAEIYDGGSDGDPTTADNTLYATQGVFVP